jgi:hypothetical protein
MPAAIPIAMAVMAATSVGTMAYGMAKGDPDMPNLTLPGNAKDDEKEAQKAATAAKKRQQQSALLSEGRGSTILTGGGTSLGQVGGGAGSQPKTQLGL